MFLIPAIDILGGKCVRLKKGDFDRVTDYGDAVDVAEKFKNDGARMLHVVDLDGAKTGKLVNCRTLSKILADKNIDVQFGGGVRTFEDAERLFDLGVKSIILGTSVVFDKNLVKMIVEKFGRRRVFVALDFKNGELAVSGWKKIVKDELNDVIEFLKLMNLRTVVVTDVSKDGMLEGPNFGLFRDFVEIGFRVIASGGISSMDDLLELKKSGLYAAVVGKALYENELDLREANCFLCGRNFLAKRVIPCLDVKNGRVVKGVNFKSLRDIGDPVKLAKFYCDAGADELVFLDISATEDGRKIFLKVIRDIAKEINIPFTVGGGVSSIADIRRLLNAGADKVSIGTAALKNSDLVKSAVNYFGSQCIVVSIDVKKQAGFWKVFVKGGREMTDVDVLDFARKMQDDGVGELLVNSLDRDGTKSGFDIKILSALTKLLNVPIIASSGAGELEDCFEVFEKAGVDAVLAASIFHDGKFSINDVKRFLNKYKINVRL